MIEREYEEQLQTGNPTGAIFALKNFDWKDKAEIEHTVPDSLVDKFAGLTVEVLLKRANELASGKITA